MTKKPKKLTSIKLTSIKFGSYQLDHGVGVLLYCGVLESEVWQQKKGAHVLKACWKEDFRKLQGKTKRNWENYEETQWNYKEHIRFDLLFYCVMLSDLHKDRGSDQAPESPGNAQID